MKPQYCAHCARLLTQTPEALAAHIINAADEMERYTSSWPRADLIDRLTIELQPGDEVIALAIGRLTIRRRDGSLSVIYQAS